jgi:glycine/D-amino acid oxidase-like deaminating enzyme
MGTRVGIVGGGIGGLTAALSLLRHGFDVHVYEQASMLGEVGAEPRRPSRMAPAWPPASRLASRLPGPISPRHCAGTKPCAFPGRLGCRLYRRPTRRGSTSPTAWNNKNATPRWLPDQPTGRSTPSAGSTATMPQS